MSNPENRQRIFPSKNGTLNAEDRQNLASLLIKAGYSVRIGKDKLKSTTVYFVEFWEECADGNIRKS